MKYRALTMVLALLFAPQMLSAQRPEVSISLNEAFFDSLLDAVFQNAPPIEFPIAANSPGKASNAGTSAYSFAERRSAACNEVIQLARENNGVRTAVRFRDGKILAPLAFTGNYNPPLIGCVPFSGYAETVIDLEFDQPAQRLVARARVLNVSLNGTAGVGGSLIAKMVQSSIDKKINPIEVLTLEKVSFLLPIRKDISLRMKAVGIRHEIQDSQLRINIAYDFQK